MSYPLKALHQLLCVELNSQSLAIQKPVSLGIRKKFNQAASEVESLQVTILEAIISAGSVSSQQATVQACQIGCTASLNSIYYQRNKLQATEGTLAAEWDALYSEVENDLLLFLKYLQQHFPSLFDKEQPVPRKREEEYRKGVEERIKTLKESIVASGIPVALQQLAVKPLVRSFSLAEASLTYKGMDYLAAYLERMEGLAGISGSTEEAWIEAMVEAENNDPAFIKYVSGQLQEESEADKPAQCQLAYWWQVRNRFIHLYSYSATSLYPHLPPCKETILGFIQKEIDSLLKKLPVATSVTSSSALTEPLFTTSLSMSQIAVMLRLFKDCSLIKSESQMALFKSLSAALRTEKTAKLSAGSLRAKFYAPERGAISTVKDRMFQMLNHLKDI